MAKAKACAKSVKSLGSPTVQSRRLLISSNMKVPFIICQVEFAKRNMFELNERLIVNKIRKNPKVSVPKIQPEVESVAGRSISQETIRNVLRPYGYYGRMAKKKPYISVVNRKKRLEFAKTNLNKSKEFWNNVIWSDECKFVIFGSAGRQLVWRKVNTELQKENLVPTVKHGGSSQMVWGCMAASGVGNLVFIDGLMDKLVYMDILKQNLKQCVVNLGMPPVYKFQ
jgi:Transposase